ncbi:MinD/ParA family protein [Serpentinicella sp. ANB-PHB4]|uniref:MinD/ParA family protein n=1 Tax=Serpentinicella sp. ANB-PHB4 TaxID=3074076 RepID=UPI002860687F|nr:MinD/ParA family protein [Serpentinicella sp. ANB-PHB4]MDR5658248.1 MinD/ParA family protein [Serpentinicella sp. ANB-PHB4]
MNDQAMKLRELINNKSKLGNDTRIVCVTSGKGGVGKTNFTINFAIALSNMNKRVVIIDADLGLANVDVVLGTFSKYTLLDVIKTDRSVKEIMTDGPNGIKIISGGSGILDLVDLPQAHIDRIVEKIEEICQYADIILIDTGAGLSKSVMSFVLASQETIIVATPEPTSMTDAYAMIKTISNTGNSTNIKVVINRAETPNEGSVTFEKLEKACEKFLGIKIKKLGFVVEDYHVSKAVKLQNPFILQFPKSNISKNIISIANKFSGESHKQRTELGGFFNKVIRLFR